MKLVNLTCPKCGGELDIKLDEGKHDTFCSYCGNHIYLDDGNQVIIHKTVDETRLKELEIEEKRRSEEAVKTEQRHNDKLAYSRTMRNRFGIGLLICFIFVIVGNVVLPRTPTWSLFMCLAMVLVPIFLLLFIWQALKVNKLMSK